MPNDGLILTSEGIAQSLPIFPAKARRKEPTREPITIARIASMKLASERNDPAEKTNKPTPKLDQSMK